MRGAERELGVMSVDDNPLMGQSMEILVRATEGLRWHGHFAGADGVTAAVSMLHPAVVLMDMAIPGTDTPALVGEVVRVSSGTRVLMLSAYLRGSEIRKCLESGASGFVSKGRTPGYITEAIRRVAAGEFVLCDQAAQVLGTAGAGVREEGPAEESVRLLVPEIERFENRVARMGSLVASLEAGATAARLPGFRELIAVRDMLAELGVAAARCDAAARLEFRSMEAGSARRLRTALAARAGAAQGLLEFWRCVAAAAAREERREPAERWFAARVGSGKPTGHVPAVSEHRELLAAIAPEAVALLPLLE